MKVIRDIRDHGDLGLPSRYREVEVYDGTGPLAMVALLREIGGCCAWHGSSACNAEPVYLVMGGANLLFAVYREVHAAGGMCHALLCERHVPDVKIDMPPKLRKSQRRELLKFLELTGGEEDGEFVGVKLAEIEK